MKAAQSRASPGLTGLFRHALWREMKRRFKRQVFNTAVLLLQVAAATALPRCSRSFHSHKSLVQTLDASRQNVGGEEVAYVVHRVERRSHSMEPALQRLPLTDHAAAHVLLPVARWAAVSRRLRERGRLYSVRGSSF